MQQLLMKTTKLCQVLLIILVASFTATANNYAGPDKEVCKGNSVTIGASGNSQYCYSWTPEEGLDDPHSPMPNASPGQTTVYTVTVTAANFEQQWTDQMTVTVFEIKDVHFSKSLVLADGETQVTASAVVTPEDKELVWQLSGDNLGCTIDQSSGLITAGTGIGTVTVQVLDPTQPTCLFRKELVLEDPVNDITAEDAEHRGRVAHTGQTLYLIGHNDAEVRAHPEQPPFRLAIPIWSGDAGIPADGQVSFLNDSPLDKTFTAGQKTVYIERLQEAEEELPIGNLYSNEAMENLQKKLRFKKGGVSLSAGFSLGNTKYKQSRAERYNDPGWAIKKEFLIGASGFVKGRITHPTFSNEFKLFSYHCLWELYLEMTATISVTGGVVKDPFVPGYAWRSKNLEGKVEGKGQIGFFVYANSPTYEIDGDISASVSVYSAVRLSGSDIQHKYGWNGVQGNVSLKLYKDINDPIIDYSGTYNLIDGGDTGWSTFYRLEE